MRVIFFGTSAFAVPSLERLAGSRHAVVLCVTQPDRRQGRGLRPEPSPVKQAAVRLGLPLAQPDRLEAGAFRALQPEVGVVVAYGKLIRRELLELPAHGMLGVHPSLLPAYRGAAPVAWALLKGETTTGVTIFRLNEQLDAGEWLLQRSVIVEPDENAEGLTARLAALGAEELLRGIDLLAAGQAAFTPQQDAAASVAPKLTKAQGRIDWCQPAETIACLVRATAPWPGASTTLKGESLKIWQARADASPGHEQAPPGAIVRAGPEAIRVATGRGLLELIEVQPAGRRRMTVKEFLAGRPIHVGDILGSAE